MEFSWNANLNKWYENQKNEYSYDSIGNLTSEIEYYWDSNLNNWNLFGKILYSYDSEANNILRVLYSWNLSNWEVDYKYDYTYDIYGSEISVYQYYWSNLSSNWSLDYDRKVIDTIVYDANNMKIYEKFYEVYDAGFFSGNFINIFSYDSLNNLKSIIKYSVDDLDSLYEYYKQEFVYDIYGNQISNLYYNWDTEWKVETKKEFFYSAIIPDTASFKTKAINNCEIEFSYEGTDFESVEVIFNNDTTVYTTNPFIVNTCSKSISDITIILRKTNGQTLTSTYDVDAILEVKELNSKTDNISVYPNPTTKNINIELENENFKVEDDFEIGGERYIVFKK